MTIAEKFGAKRLVPTLSMNTRHFALSVERLDSQRSDGPLLSTSQGKTENIAPLTNISLEGIGPSLAVEGAMTREVLEAYIEQVLAPGSVLDRE